MEVSAIYKEFHRHLLGYVKSKIRSKEDAEDILQNVFIKISSNVNNVTTRTNLKGWIFTITRNAIIDYYRVNATKKKAAIVEGIISHAFCIANARLETSTNASSNDRVLFATNAENSPKL